MTAVPPINIAILGASGYTGADLVRLAVRHPRIAIKALAAKTHAGKRVEEVFAHLGGLGLPDLVEVDDIDYSAVDAVFCGLPHGAANSVIGKLPESVKVIDISADFRLDDAAVYAKWYGLEHAAPHLLAESAYGLTE
ncbi:MAG: N-acetyl-gamma-glutamyl-phosphate reductase, partial [Hyphomicrobiaceae bacterium]